MGQRNSTAKMPKGKRKSIPRPRNGGTWTEAQFYSSVRSALRRRFMYWVPLRTAKLAARRPYVGPNKLQKWELQCSACNGWFKDKDVQVDHIEEVGSLRCYEDLPDFLRRLVPEDPKAFRVLCKGCHNTRTQESRKLKAENVVQISPSTPQTAGVGSA
jgi:hypothetical protein